MGIKFSGSELSVLLRFLMYPFPPEYNSALGAPQIHSRFSALSKAPAGKTVAKARIIGGFVWIASFFINGHYL